MAAGFDLGLNESNNGFTTTRNRGCGEATKIAAEKALYQVTVAYPAIYFVAWVD